MACRGGELRHRAGPAAGQNQIRAANWAGHVLEKSLHLPAIRSRSTGSVRGLGCLGVAGSGLVQDGEAGDGIQQRPGNLRHALVQRARTLAAPITSSRGGLSGDGVGARRTRRVRESQ